VCNGASGLTPTCAEAHDGAEPERKSNSFAPTEGCWLAHTLFVLTSPSLGSTVDLHPSTSLLNLGFRNYSFFGRTQVTASFPGNSVAFRSATFLRNPSGSSLKERRFNQWALRPIPTIETGGGQLPGPSPPIPEEVL